MNSKLFFLKIYISVPAILLTLAVSLILVESETQVSLKARVEPRELTTKGVIHILTNKLEYKLSPEVSKVKIGFGVDSTKYHKLSENLDCVEVSIKEFNLENQANKSNFRIPCKFKEDKFLTFTDKGFNWSSGHKNFYSTWRTFDLNRNGLTLVTIKPLLKLSEGLPVLFKIKREDIIKRISWQDLKQEDKERLVEEYSTVGNAGLTDVEKSNILNNAWEDYSPEGIKERDYRSSVIEIFDRSKESGYEYDVITPNFPLVYKFNFAENSDVLAKIILKSTPNQKDINSDGSTSCTIKTANKTFSNFKKQEVILPYVYRFKTPKFKNTATFFTASCNRESLAQAVVINNGETLSRIKRKLTIHKLYSSNHSRFSLKEGIYNFTFYAKSLDELKKIISKFQGYGNGIDIFLSQVSFDKFGTILKENTPIVKKLYKAQGQIVSSKVQEIKFPSEGELFVELNRRANKLELEKFGANMFVPLFPDVSKHNSKQEHYSYISTAKNLLLEENRCFKINSIPIPNQKVVKGDGYNYSHSLIDCIENKELSFQAIMPSIVGNKNDTLVSRKVIIPSRNVINDNVEETISLEKVNPEFLYELESSQVGKTKEPNIKFYNFNKETNEFVDHLVPINPNTELNLVHYEQRVDKPLSQFRRKWLISNLFDVNGRTTYKIHKQPNQYAKIVVDLFWESELPYGYGVSLSVIDESGKKIEEEYLLRSVNSDENTIEDVYYFNAKKREKFKFRKTISIPLETLESSDEITFRIKKFNHISRSKIFAKVSLAEEIH